MNIEDENSKSKKVNIKAIVTIVIIAFIIIGVIYIVQRNDAEAQIKDFQKCVENKDEESVADYLSNKNRVMTNVEASHLINYLNKKENKKEFNDVIDVAINNVKKGSSTSELATYKDKNNQPILDFNKNGKQMLFLDKISIEPHYRSVYIKELDNNATYILSKNDKVPVDKNKLNKLGSFVVGNYTVNLKKEFDYSSVEGTVNGKIHINTDKKKDGKIIAEQSFPQTKIRIKLHNEDKLDSKNKKLLINGDIKPYKENKTYGYFPNEDTFSVKAEGVLNNHTFKTESVNVYKGMSNNSTQVVNLYFSKKEINQYIKAEKKTKKEVERIVKEYIESLNKAYKNKSYEDVKDYIKSGSEAEKQLKQRFKHKQNIKFKDIKVTSIEKNNEKYRVEVSKKVKGNTINTQYVIDEDSKQIESYKDL